MWRKGVEITNHGAGTDVHDFPGLDQVMERFHGLFRWSGGVIAVNLENVDVAGAKTYKGGIDGFEDSGTGKACILSISYGCKSMFEGSAHHLD